MLEKGWRRSTYRRSGSPEFAMMASEPLARTMSAEYTPDHARSGVDAELPAIETWPNQYRGYRVTARIDEFTSVCPKTGLPDFGVITIEYEPAEVCFELKSLKMYLLAYRDLGIFQENIVNRVRDDLAKALNPVWLKVTGEFTPRGGIYSTVTAEYRTD